MKRSFEPQRRGGKVNLHSIGSVDDDDDDYGFGGPRRRFSLSSRRRKLLRTWSFPKLLPFRNWQTAWPKKAPTLLKNLWLWV